MIESECGHCRQPLELEIDSQLNIRVLSGSAEPYVYVPQLELQKLEPSIIDGF